MSSSAAGISGYSWFEKATIGNDSTLPAVTGTVTGLTGGALPAVTGMVTGLAAGALPAVTSTVIRRQPGRSRPGNLLPRTGGRSAHPGVRIHRQFVLWGGCGGPSSYSRLWC